MLLFYSQKTAIACPIPEDFGSLTKYRAFLTRVSDRILNKCDSFSKLIPQRVPRTPLAREGSRLPFWTDMRYALARLRPRLSARFISVDVFHGLASNAYGIAREETRELPTCSKFHFRRKNFFPQAQKQSEM